MQNNDLTKAIKDLEREIQLEVQELQTKETELHKREAEVVDLKNKLRENEIAIPKLRQEIIKIKGDQGRKHSEVLRIQKSYEDSLRKLNLKPR